MSFTSFFYNINDEIQPPPLISTIPPKNFITTTCSFNQRHTKYLNPHLHLDNSITELHNHPIPSFLLFLRLNPAIPSSSTSSHLLQPVSLLLLHPTYTRPHSSSSPSN